MEPDVASAGAKAKAAGEGARATRTRRRTSAMRNEALTGEKTGQRNIPAGMIDEARKHVYEAALRTPLVRLNA